MNANNFLVLKILFLIVVAIADGVKKRELPLSHSCDPRTAGSCHKGDLISTRIADCEKDSLLITCDPINDIPFSSVVDIPDVSRWGVNCKPDSSRRIICGTPGTDTRCVCDKAWDISRPKETLANQCRCQYWPPEDPRKSKPSYCTQYDNGGTSGVHFFTCCNNCADSDSSCDGGTYQGGGRTDAYCGKCGVNSPLGGGRITYRFNCDSCTQQRECERMCNSEWFGLTKVIPGLCPRWAGCFRGCCVEATEQARRKRQTSETFEFCGDFKCQNGENHTSCPVDCCPVVNPSECSDLCSPDCCLHPQCCVIGTVPDDSSIAGPSFIVYLMSILLLVILLKG